MKKCATCGPRVGFQVNGKFHKSSSSKDGLQSICKKCSSSYGKKRKKEAAALRNASAAAKKFATAAAKQAAAAIAETTTTTEIELTPTATGGLRIDIWTTIELSKSSDVLKNLLTADDR